jgi:hypothetical protein
MNPRTLTRAHGTPRRALSVAALLSVVLAMAATTLLSVPATADTALGDPTEAALELGLAPSAQAATTNVVPNPGFEQGGCGDTPDLCGWKAVEGVISQDTTYPHSGSASMGLYGLSGSASATTDPAFCVPIGPGTHAASFWYRTPEQGNPDYDVAVLYFGASFYTGPDCTGSAWSDGLSETPVRDNAWHEAIGSLVAPPGTVSGSFGVDIGAGCNVCFYVVANFDDLDVETEVAADTTPPETTITSGPSGTTDSTSAAFGFAANEPSTFECSLDSGGFAACASPASYTGLGDGSHTFRVRATDAAGNADPTPEGANLDCASKYTPDRPLHLPLLRAELQLRRWRVDRHRRDDPDVWLGLRRRDGRQRQDRTAHLCPSPGLHGHVDGDRRRGRQRHRREGDHSNPPDRTRLQGEGPSAGGHLLERA